MIRLIKEVHQIDTSLFQPSAGRLLYIFLSGKNCNHCPLLLSQPVLCYDTIVQSTGNTWHIPYDDNSLERSSYEVPTRWLCLQQK